MRRALAIGVGSIAAHAAVIAAVTDFPDERERLAVSRPPLPADLAISTEPVEIQLLPLPPPSPPPSPSPSPSPSPPPSPSPSPSRSVGRAAIATGSPSATAAAEVPSPAGPSGLLQMRGHPGQADLTLPDDSAIIDEIVHRPPAIRPDTTGRVEPGGDGGSTARDLTFTAVIDADGHVARIDDAPGARVELHVPGPREIPGAVREHLVRWTDDAYHVSNRTGQDLQPAKEGQRASGNERADGRVYKVLSGGFDVTDGIMRLAGGDPYAARKRRFLEETRDERVQLGKDHRAAAMARADQTILTHLRQLWRRTDLSIEDKRAAVFELWDECAEPGVELDDALAAGGARARAALLRWVDVHLPEGSADAFTTDELARWNARRRSRARFAPHAGDE